MLDSSLAKGMLIYSFGGFGSKAINFAIYPLLTFYLTKTDLGYYDLIVNSIFLVIPIATFQISDGIYRFVLSKDDKFKQKDVISTGFNFILISTIVVLLILLFFFNFFFRIEYSFLVFAMSFFYAINQAFKQISRGIRKNRNYVISDIIYSISFISFLFLLLDFFNLELKGVMISFVIANVLSASYLLISTGIISYLSLKSSPQKKIYHALLRYSTPLIPNTLSWWLVGSANTYIITIILGLNFNGLYAVAFKFSSIIYILNRIFSLAWQDQLIGGITNDSNFNSKVFNRLLSFLLTIVILLILLMKPILNLIVTEEYFIVWHYIPFLLIATVFSSISSYFGAFYLSWGKTNKIFVTTLIGAIIAIVSSIILTKIYGLMGTSVSMAIGFGTVAVSRYLDTKINLNLKFNFRLLILILMIIMAIALNYYL